VKRAWPPIAYTRTFDSNSVQSSARLSNGSKSLRQLVVFRIKVVVGAAAIQKSQVSVR